MDDMAYSLKYTGSKIDELLDKVDEFEQNVFIAQYNITTWQQITDAVAQKKLVVCYYDNTGAQTAGGGDYADKVCYEYDGQNSVNGDHYFHMINSGSSMEKRVIFCRQTPTSDQQVWNYKSYEIQNAFIAAINSTTYEEVVNANNKGKLIFAKSSSGKLYEFSDIVSDVAYFVGLGTGSSCTKVYYKLTSSGWSYSNCYYLMMNTSPSALDAAKQYAVKKVNNNTIKLEEVISGGGGTGRINDISMNGENVPVSEGVADLGTVITQHQSLANYYTKIEVDQKFVSVVKKTEKTIEDSDWQGDGTVKTCEIDASDIDVTSTCAISVSPAPESMANAIKYNLYCYTQSTDKLGFKCIMQDATPSTGATIPPMTVYIINYGEV